MIKIKQERRGTTTAHYIELDGGQIKVMFIATSWNGTTILPAMLIWGERTSASESGWWYQNLNYSCRPKAKKYLREIAEFWRELKRRGLAKSTEHFHHC